MRSRTLCALLAPAGLAGGLIAALLVRPGSRGPAVGHAPAPAPVLADEIPAESPRAVSATTAVTPADPVLGVMAADEPVVKAGILDWLGRWQQAGPGEEPGLLEEARALAADRARSMQALMRRAPDQALAQALTWSQWAALPIEVRALVEEPFSLTGDYAVRSDCRPAAERRRSPQHLTWLDTPGGWLKVQVSGAWRDVTSKEGLPVQGIRFDGEAVLRPGVMQVLDDSDAAAVAEFFPQREDRADGPVTALIGGQRVSFPSSNQAGALALELTAALALNGPHTVSAGLSVAYSSSSGVNQSVIGGASAASLAWSASPKRVLVIRLDFPNLPGAPLTREEWQSRLTEVSSLLGIMSYGKTHLSTQDVTGSVLRLSQDSNAYTAGSLAAEALTLAANAAFQLASYDVFIFSFKPTETIGGAFANLGSSHQWDTGVQLTSTIVHELGHNLGLGHANFWVGTLAGGDWTGRNGITNRYGPAGNDEYGDAFDLMGDNFRHAPGSDPIMPAGHFSMDSKVCLGWLDPAHVTDATTSGIHRIHRFDHSATTGAKRALSFRTSDQKRVWVGLRRNFAGNPLLSTGAYVVWAHAPNGHELIDCTPLSRLDAIPGNAFNVAELDREDSALPVGVSWTTPDGSVRLTNLGLGGATPDEFLDLQVELIAPAAAAQDFAVYQDQAESAYGLNARFVNSSLRAFSSQADWAMSQPIFGTRADPMPLYWDNGMGVRSTVGVTGGTDGDWQDFSVQYDGWLRVNRATRFLSYGADGTRFWIDANNNGAYATTAPEFTAGTWGSGGGPWFSPFSDWVDPGLYRVRIQHEQDADGGNRWGFMGRSDRWVTVGGGVWLAGAGYVSAPGGAAISGAFTVEAWAQPAATTGVLNIVSTRNDFGFDMKLQNGSMLHGDIGTGSSWLTTSADAPYNYRVGEWYHIAYCVGGGSYEIYVNGWKAGSGAYSGTPLLCDEAHPFRIGSYDGTLENFTGRLDEVRIWNAKRTGEQIASNFRRSMRGDEPGLASCWKLDDTFVDSTGARNGSGVGTTQPIQMHTPVTTVGTLFVNSNASAGPGSLRAAVEHANTLAGPVTINVVATGTIQPSVLALPGTMTINGPGAGALTLDGATGFLLEVPNAASLTLRGVTLANSAGAGEGIGSGAGTAVWNRGGTVLIEDCRFVNCEGGGDYGGACFNRGNFTARRCVFVNNRILGLPGDGRGPTGSGGGGGGGAAMGGAIFSDTGSLVLEDCDFVGNLALGGDGGDGGAVGSGDPSGGDGADPTGGAGGAAPGAHGVAGGYGGGGGGGAQWTSAATPGNGGAAGYGGGGGGGGRRASGGDGGTGGPGDLGGNGGRAAGAHAGGGGGGAGLGGAVYVRSGTAVIERCAFRGNSATGGAGGAGAPGLAATSGQPAQGLGGAIYHDPSARLTVRNLSFHGNTSSTPGAGDTNDLEADPGLTAGFNFEPTPSPHGIYGDATGNTIPSRHGSPAVSVVTENSNGYLECLAGQAHRLRLADPAHPGNSARGLGFHDSFTAVARIRPTSVAGDKIVFGQAGSATTGSLHFGLRNGQAYMGFWDNDLAGNATVPADVWTHLAFVYDRLGGQRSIYVNGQLDATEVGVANGIKDADVLIGRSDAVSVLSSGFVGGIDDVLIFSNALSAGQIAALAASAPITGTGFTNALVPSNALALPPPGDGRWSVRELFRPGVTFTTISHADWVQATPASASGLTYAAPLINQSDPDDLPSPADERLAGYQPFGLDTAGAGSHFCLAARTRLRITEEDDYTFGFTGDDGMRLRIRGALFTSSTRVNTANAANPAHRGDTLIFPNITGAGQTLGVARLLPGEYEVEFLWFQGQFGLFCEVLAARGAKSAFDSLFRPLTEFQFDPGTRPETTVSPGSGATRVFAWTEKPGWTPEISTTLAPGSWTPVIPVTTAGGFSRSIHSGARLFFRLREP